MKKIISKFLPFLILLTGLAPLTALAQSAPCVGNCVSQGLTSIAGIFPNGGFSSITANPLAFIAWVIRILLYLAGAVAVLFVIIGGYQYMTSGGNEETAEKGRKTLINAIIGIVIIILSYVIVNVIVNLVSGNGLSLGVVF